MYDVYQSVKHAIVSVIAHVSNDVYITGTGFIISENGHVVTSAHNVMKNKYIGGSPYSDTIYVCFELTHIVTASVVGIDRRADVCVLKMNMSGLTIRNPPLSFANIMRVGSKCYIFGCMEDYGIHSFHDGYVERTNFVTAEIIDSMATNIRITKGISGSPILNSQGQVIGIANWFSEKTCGGASCTLLKKIVQKIITNRGPYTKGFFGLRCRPILAQDIIYFEILFMFNNMHGMFVEKVSMDIKSSENMYKYDIISTIDNVSVGISSHSLDWFMYAKEPGDSVKVGYYKFIPRDAKPFWDTNIRFTTMTMINYPEEYDVPVVRGRIQLLS
jgi:S1-C subfamily serine protease